MREREEGGPGPASARKKGNGKAVKWQKGKCKRKRGEQLTRTGEKERRCPEREVKEMQIMHDRVSLVREIGQYRGAALARPRSVDGDTKHLTPRVDLISSKEEKERPLFLREKGGVSH